MRHRNAGRKLGRMSAPREALLRNLTSNVIVYERVRTTAAKANEVRPFVERMITKGRENNLTARRELLSFFYTEEPVRKILEVLGPKYMGRKGGYTRITKIGRRLGDSAEMVQIELI